MPFGLHAAPWYKMWDEELHTAVNPTSPARTSAHKARVLKWGFTSFGSTALLPPSLPSSWAASSGTRTNPCKDELIWPFKAPRHNLKNTQAG